MNAVRQGGFQQVDVNGTGTQEDQSAGPSGGNLGEAASSDAILMNGSVGQSNANQGAFGNFAPGGPGGGAPGGAFPGQSAGGSGFGGMIINVPISGPSSVIGGGGQGGGPPRPRGGGGGGQFGGGVGGLYGMQRIMRQQVNRIRFSFFDRYENSSFDARPYSLTEPNPHKISHWSENFGANLGGPLRIPHVYDGRDKTFFFLNYTLARQLSPVDTFATVPTLPELGGNFADRNAQLFDPCANPSCTSIINGPRPSLGSSIPAGRINSAAQGLLKLLPAPNLPGFVDNFHLQDTVPIDSDSVNFHLLHTISSKLNLSAGYNFNSVRQDALVNFPQFGSKQSIRNQNVNFNLNQNISPKLINSIGLNWSRSRIDTLSDNSFLNNIAGNLGITGISTNPIDFGVPSINFTNFTGLSDPVPALIRNQTLRVMDNVTWSLSKHTLQAGLELRRLQNNTVSDPIPRGLFTFTGLLTANLNAQGQPVPGTGFDLADFLLGLPQATTEQFGNAATYFRHWGFVGYFQDDWRFHPQFTLELGVRYELATPEVELFNHISNIVLNSDISAVAVVTPGQPNPFGGALPNSLIHGSYNDWAPRLGIAWRPFAKDSTVVRAGYSIFYNDSIYTQLGASLANQPPFAEAGTLETSTNQVLTLQNGFPSQSSTTVKNTVAVDPNYKVGYAQLWDLSIEHSLGKGWTTEVTYTGTKGTHLDLLRAPNRAPPGSPLTAQEQLKIANASGFTFDTSGASSLFEALQVRVQKRMSRGFLVLGQYTYSKSIDNASSIGGGTPVVVQDDNNFSAERGLSSFDMRHQFRGFTVYELPFGDKKRWAKHGTAEHLFGNLRVNSGVQIQTGTPYTARVLGTQADNTGTGVNFSERADQVGNPNGNGCGGAPLNFFNTGAFALPPLGRFGNAARNTIEGPCLFNWNLGITRFVQFGKDKEHRFEARWEINNVTNTPNFTGLSTVVNSATYGRVLGARSMRAMDISLRFAF